MLICLENKSALWHCIYEAFLPIPAVEDDVATAAIAVVVCY
jgi:hypothetical protein